MDKMWIHPKDSWTYLYLNVLFICTDVEFECPILKVVHNTANDNFNRLGVMVKGTIVEVDSNPFKTWYVIYSFQNDVFFLYVSFIGIFT